MFEWEIPEELEFDGVSMKSILESNKAVRDEIFCHFPDKLCTSLRKGDWKLIRWYCDNPDQTDRYELYNLAEDVGEAINLVATETDMFEKLSLRMDVLLEETEGLIPVPNPDYDPDAK
jgi:arylsulfatase A-like enzyme